MMDWLLIIPLIYSIIFIIKLIFVFLFLLNFKSVGKLPEHLPEVTILVCARNESVKLPRCLASMAALDYPKDRLEILIGDDNSEDKTWEVIQFHISQYQYMYGFQVEPEKNGLIAKANVLNQLIEVSKHEFQVIIDADMAVQPAWLKTMVTALQDFDMVSGYTQIERFGPWAQLQYFDWQIVLHTMKAMADTFRPISILGNNMGFRKSAYDQVGGFLALGPTDVEDLGLLQRFQKAGLKTGLVIDKRGFAKTLPQPSFSEMLTQRCRWMNGVFTHHWLLGLPALFARFWVLVTIIFAFINVEVSLFILLYAYAMSFLKLISIPATSSSKIKLLWYEPIFISLLDTFALIRILVKGKVSWKGRKF